MDTTTVGSKTFTVDATDAAGVSSSRTSTYTVVWPFAGFDSPVSASGFVDAKAGEPIPLTDKSWKGTCRILTLQLADTTRHRVSVHFVN